VIKIDTQLIKNLVIAVDSRQTLQNLPPGLKEHCLQYEKMCLDDVKVQLGNDIVASQPSIAPQVLSSTLDIIMMLIKKHWTTATWVSVLSVIVSYLTK
jgi:hypothetical protein